MPARYSPPALVLTVLLAGCASTQNAYAPVLGTWGYTVYDTPQGNVDGEIMLTDVAGALGGTLSTEITFAPADLQNVRLSGDSLLFDATLTVDGQSIQTSTAAVIEGDSMEGQIEVVDIGTFRIAGTKSMP